jgi:hypothetical protein
MRVSMQPFKFFLHPNQVWNFVFWRSWHLLLPCGILPPCLMWQLWSRWFYCTMAMWLYLGRTWVLSSTFLPKAGNTVSNSVGSSAWCHSLVTWHHFSKLKSLALILVKFYTYSPYIFLAMWLYSPSKCLVENQFYNYVARQKGFI